MPNKAVTVLMVLVAWVNLAPVIGLLSAEQLGSLYGIAVANPSLDPNLEILLRHRALMFGLLGGLMLYSAFRPAWQPAAMVLALISMAGFIVLAGSVGDYNDQIAGIINIDIIALLLLFVAISLRVFVKRRRPVI